MKIVCPFLNEFGNHIKCPYLDFAGICDKIEINVGNGDAWCNCMIHRSLDQQLKWEKCIEEKL